MIHLRSVEPLREAWTDEYPFSVPTIASLEPRRIEHEVLFLVGENASGKSTLLEAIALAADRLAIGADDTGRDETLAAVRPLARALRLAWHRRHGRGFFLRAEDFFNFSRRIRKLRRELLEEAKTVADPREILAERRELLDRYGGDLDDLSHGESFLRLLMSRVVPGGLYLLDEPEAALSPRGQLAFLAFLLEAVAEKSQFIVATHSPIVLSCPGAAIWSFEDGAIRDRSYDELDHVRFYREYLAQPGRFLRHL
ncbi:MAG: AAA family ATPase [Planctomycetota bacterium JB042]